MNKEHFERRSSAASLGVGSGRQIRGSRNHGIEADKPSAERSELQTGVGQTRAGRRHRVVQGASRHSETSYRFRETPPGNRGGDAEREAKLSFGQCGANLCGAGGLWC